MPFGGLASLGLAQALPKVVSSIRQGVEASRLKLQDTTPAAFREKIGLDRQAAVSGRLPGLNGQLTRLGQVQAGALQAARLGAASGSDYLAAAQAADARRQAGELQLGVQGQQFQDRSRAVLGTDLSQQAAYQQHDLDTYNRTKAALTQASAENAANAVNSIAGYAAAGINRNDSLAESAADRAAGLPAATSTAGLGIPATQYDGNGYTPGLPGLRRTRYAKGYNFGLNY